MQQAVLPKKRALPVFFSSTVANRLTVLLQPSTITYPIRQFYI